VVKNLDGIRAICILNKRLRFKEPLSVSKGNQGGGKIGVQEEVGTIVKNQNGRGGTDEFMSSTLTNRRDHQKDLKNSL